MRNRKGAAYLLVVVLIFTVAVAASAVFELSHQGMATTVSRINFQAASDIAEGGINRAMWEYKGGLNTPPFSLHESFSNGNFNVTLVDNNVNQNGTVLITASGTVNGVTVTQTRIMGNRNVNLRAFDETLFIDGDLNTSARIITGTAGTFGDVYINGVPKADGTGSVFNGNLSFSGSKNKTSTLVTGHTSPSCTVINAPNLNTLYYSLNANRSYLLGKTFTGMSFNSPYEIVYVLGNVTINAGSISGTGTIVASGNITITGNLSYSTVSDKISFISGGSILLQGVTSTTGVYYAAGSTFSTDGQVNILNGMIVAQALNLRGTLTVIRDPDFDSDKTLASKMHLPGY